MYAYLILGLLLRVGFFAFGLYQDANFPLPYTDIDYYVFTDAARFVSQGLSPFLRATYRYTPLLAWAMVPSITWFFSFGKFIFIMCDLLTGYLILKALPSNKKLALIWLFNPMVITISTRGSSESLLTSFILLAVHLLTKESKLSLIFGSFVFGLCVHLKIYPFIYTPTLLLFLDPIFPIFTIKRFILAVCSLTSFLSLTYWMYYMYGYEYLYESYIYHLVRLDHRHNFSIYNVLLYYTSYDNSLTWSIEKLAFIPQLGLSLILIPLTFSKGLQLKSKKARMSILFNVLFIQTFTFIAFNKVCTSQYFIWFLCFLPQYISCTTISWQKGALMSFAWVFTQGLWLFHGWKLEFMGDHCWIFEGLFLSSSAFFLAQIWMICVFIEDTKLQMESELQLEAHKIV